MRDPVVASDGHTYERSKILHVIRRTGLSPMTRAPLYGPLFPNYALREAYDEITRMRNQLQRKEEVIACKNSELASKTDELARKEAELARATERIAFESQQAASYRNTASGLQAALSEFRGQVEEQRQWQAALDAERDGELQRLRERDGELQRLRNKIRELEEARRGATAERAHGLTEESRARTRELKEKADIAHVRRAPNPQEQEDAWRREVSDGNHHAKLPESVEERRREQERGDWGPAPPLEDSDGNKRSMYEDQQQRAKCWQ